jgi:DNA-binding transcriptional LysR family regulator
MSTLSGALDLCVLVSLDVSIDRAYVDIVEARFDAGIWTGERLARDMVAVRISNEMPFSVTASPAYLKKHGIPNAPQDLTNHACIRFRLPSGALVPWRFGKKRRTFEVHVDGPLIASEPGIAITAASTVRVLCSCPMRMLPGSLPRAGS